MPEDQPIHHAARDGDVRAVREALAAGVAVDVLGKDVRK